MTTQPDSGSLIHVYGSNRVIHRGLMQLVLMSILAMAMMAISAINVALPSIESSLGASNSQVQWMLAGYALVYGMVLVPAGRVGDVLGRSSVFMVGLAVFTLGSLGCAVAQDPIWLNAMRIAQGVGAGIASPQVNGAIVQYFNGLARAKAFAMFGLVVSVSVAVAPSITGVLINWLGAENGWRASFFWNVPIGVTALVAGIRWLPFETERNRRAQRAAGTLASHRIDLDPLGMVLLTGSVLCTMMPFMIKTLASFGLLLVAGVLGFTWVRWERAHKARGGEPMVDLSLFAHRSFTNGVLVSGVQFLGATSIFTVLALYVQSGLGVSAIVSGLLGLPNATASAWASLWAGHHVLNNGRRIVAWAFVPHLAGIAGTMMIAHFVEAGDLDAPWLAAPLVLSGIGVGAINSANQTLALADIPVEMGGTSGAVKQVAERMGTAVGNAMISGTLFAGAAAAGWALGFQLAFGLIGVVLLVAAVLAVLDLRMLGPGAATRTWVSARSNDLEP